MAYPSVPIAPDAQRLRGNETVNDICTDESCNVSAVAKGECRRQYQNRYHRERRQRMRAEWIEQGGGACVQCDSTDGLKIDHIDPEAKSYEISAIWNRAVEVRVAELAKCQILCRSCHQEKARLEQIGPHGRPGRYKNGCRFAE